MIKNRKTKKYLVYALGEIVLVIVGILIALQIDNWNSERKDRLALQNYLGSIARNMEHDLARLERLRTRRGDNYLQATAINQGRMDRPLVVEQVTLAANGLERAEELMYFNPNTSGYEVLKSSGLVGNLHGNDIESLLFDYYDTVDRISRMEADHNATVRDLRLQTQDQLSADLETWEFLSPESLSTERFDELQPAILEFLRSDGYVNLLQQSVTAAEIIGEYARAMTFGSVFIRMVENGLLHFDEQARDSLAGVQGISNSKGHPFVIRDGQVQSHNFHVNIPDSTVSGLRGAARSESTGGGWNVQALQRDGDSLRLHYAGDASWAALSISVPDLDRSSARASLDYSMFEGLQLELRGARDGDRLLINLKDSDDPDDGSQTNVELILSSEWQTYDIGLERFENADLEKLHVVLGILFYDQTQTLYIRNVRFLD
jgi:hypothetical protein